MLSNLQSYPMYHIFNHNNKINQFATFPLSQTVYFTGMMVFTLASQMYLSVLVPVLVRVPEYLSTSTSTSTNTITLELTSTSTVRVPKIQYASTSTEYEYPSPDSVSVGDPPRSSGKHQFSDGSLIPDSPNTSGGKSMTHSNTPFTMISPDRATNTKRPHRNGIGDKPIALNDRSVLNELSVNDVSNVVIDNISVDTVMTQALEMGNDDTIVNEPNDFISDLKKLRYCNPKNMIIGHININSLRNKYDPIRSILQNGLCDIFTLSETKLDEWFPTAQFHIANFVLHRKDRNAHGGGVITYRRSDLPHRRRYDMELNASGFEFIILEVQLYKKEKWLICSCYKPPSIKDSVFEKSFSELLNSLQIESSHILIIGDINFDMTKENTLSNICGTYDLKNHVCGPTCNKGAKSTALDVILSSEPKRFKHTIN